MSVEMESNIAEYLALGEGSTPKLDKFRKVSIIPLIYLIFCEVSGGPFGVEDTVSTLAGEVDDPEVAKVIRGVRLRSWVQAASALSNMGMFVAEMSSDSFQLLGMAPEFFARRSCYGTPLIGILFSASGVILLSWLSFQEIVAAENFLHCFGMLMDSQHLSS